MVDIHLSLFRYFLNPQLNYSNLLMIIVLKIVDILLNMQKTLLVI